MLWQSGCYSPVIVGVFSVTSSVFSKMSLLNVSADLVRVRVRNTVLLTEKRKKSVDNGKQFL